MSIKTNELISAVEDFAPPGIQEPWDNSGWQINFDYEEVSKVLVALEVTSDVIAEAKNHGIKLILTHHPVLFTPIKSIDHSTMIGRYLLDLIAEDVSVYAAHTSFDAARGGMNDTLAEAFGLVNVVPFPPIGKIASDVAKINGRMLRVGELEKPEKFSEIILRAEDLFDMKDRLKVVGSPDAVIRKIAVCGGGGGSFVKDMIGEDVDLYITSDIRHDDAKLAGESGIALIDGGHYGTEKHFVPIISGRLRHIFGDALTIIETETSADPFKGK
ncbi:MAG: Nif3-like dinuclear metal center hexameric protein [Clostridiales Family XIII bacterium]|jgi:dinuclear metal center YbgI/SA1388 family protein|nr:Nif3-like dinuclear metal center hexameric protein [Clostridiales Family XIII bacterium]